jgi:hypothetical protein
LSRARPAVAVFAALALGGAPAVGDEADPEDALSYRVHVDTVGRLFRRETFPDPSGALVAGDVAAPLFHQALLRVDGADLPWRRDSFDVEVAAWGNLELAADSDIGRVDADVHILRVRHRLPHFELSLGRQVRAGGAARFAHFDGAAAAVHGSWPGARLQTELGLEGYGGFTVLPRWAERPGYQLLGSAADSLLRDPEAFPEPAREDQWLAGARAYVSEPGLAAAGISFHEAREDGGLAARRAGLDLELTPISQLAWSGQALLDLDASALADVRASLDVRPHRRGSIGATYHHLSPALLLSHQAVLSVFSTQAFDEWGLEGELEPLTGWRAHGFGFVERFDDGSTGWRSGGRLRYRTPDKRASAGVGYHRTVETENGYHAVRAFASVAPWAPLTLTADGFLYFYDEPIVDISTSIVGSLSAAWRAHRWVEVMAGTTLARSPYASLDAQGIARVSVELDGGRP